MNQKIIFTQSDADIVAALTDILACIGHEARLARFAANCGGADEKAYRFCICNLSDSLTDDGKVNMGYTGALRLSMCRKKKDVKGFFKTLKEAFSSDFEWVVSGDNQQAVDAVKALLAAGCRVQQRTRHEVSETSVRSYPIPCWDVWVPRS